MEYYDKFCKCGCKMKIPIKKAHKYYGIPNYILNHRAKIKTPEQNKKMVETRKKNNSYNSNRKGMKFEQIYGEEKANRIKKMISESHLGKPSPKNGINLISLVGIKRAKKIKKKISRSMKGKHTSPKTEFKIKDKRIIGKNNCMWKGGRTSLTDQIRHGVEYKKWRMNVYKTDLFKCVKCDYKGKNIVAHHIVPVSECLDLDYPELILDIDNGETLCKSCHAKEHTNISPKTGKFIKRGFEVCNA